MNMFEKAARKKLKLNFKGQCTVEDLFDLSVEELDGIYQELRAEQKESDGESLIKKASTANVVLNLKVDIVKYIVESKLEEADNRKKRAANKMRKSQLENLLSKKEEQKMLNMSEEEIQKEIESLDE